MIELVLLLLLLAYQSVIPKESLQKGPQKGHCEGAEEGLLLEDAIPHQDSAVNGRDLQLFAGLSSTPSYALRFSEKQEEKPLFMFPSSLLVKPQPK